MTHSGDKFIVNHSPAPSPIAPTLVVPFLAEATPFPRPETDRMMAGSSLNPLNPGISQEKHRGTNENWNCDICFHIERDPKIGQLKTNQSLNSSPRRFLTVERETDKSVHLCE